MKPISLNYIVGTPLILEGGGGKKNLPKIESLGGGGRGVQNFLLERGDKPEKGELM